MPNFCTTLFMKHENLVSDSMMDIMYMIEANIWKSGITQQVVTKFDSLKTGSGGDAVMSSDANYHRKTCNKLLKLSSSSIIIRTRHCICTVINFESNNFCHHLLQDPILLDINFKCISHLTWLCHDHHTVSYQIYI